MPVTTTRRSCIFFLKSPWSFFIRKPLLSFFSQKALLSFLARKLDLFKTQKAYFFWFFSM